MPGRGHAGVRPVARTPRANLAGRLQRLFQALGERGLLGSRRGLVFFNIRIGEIRLERSGRSRLRVFALRARVGLRGRQREQALHGCRSPGCLGVPSPSGGGFGFRFRRLVLLFHPQRLLLVQLLEYEPLERLYAPRVALVQPRVQLDVLPLDQTERGSLLHLSQRAQEIERLARHGRRRVTPRADRRRLRQHVRQETELARQTKLPSARVSHQHLSAQLGDEVQHLKHGVHVAVGEVVGKPEQTRPVVVTKVKLLESRLVRAHAFDHPVVQLGQRALGQTAGGVARLGGVGFGRLHRLLLHEL